MEERRGDGGQRSKSGRSPAAWVCRVGASARARLSSLDVNPQSPLLFTPGPCFSLGCLQTSACLGLRTSSCVSSFQNVVLCPPLLILPLSLVIGFCNLSGGGDISSCRAPYSKLRSIDLLYTVLSRAIHAFLPLSCPNSEAKSVLFNRVSLRAAGYTAKL